MRHFPRIRVLAAVAVVVFLGAARPAAADEPAPDCHVLAVGIDSYADPANNLRGCVNDARAAARFYEGQAGTTYGSADVRLLVDGRATRAAVLDEMSRLRGAGKPGDHYVLFISSHGNRDNGQWYMVAHDQQPVTDTEILAWSQALMSRGGTVFIVVDACKAGQIRLNARRLLENYREPGRGGLVLLLCSVPGQNGNALGQYSSFARALAEALGGTADVDGDGYVTLREVRHYTYHRTVQLAGTVGAEQDAVVDYSFSVPETLRLSRPNPASRPQQVAGVAGSDWTGRETFGRLTFQFHRDGRAVMLDDVSNGPVHGTWSQDGQRVTVRFRNCVYLGEMDGERLGGTAQYTSGAQGQWSFQLQRMPQTAAVGN